MPKLQSEIGIGVIKITQAKKLIGKCPDCGEPMRRYCTIGPDRGISENAVYCPKCKGFMRRSVTYGVETFAVCADPRTIKNPLPVVVKAVEP